MSKYIFLIIGALLATMTINLFANPKQNKEENLREYVTKQGGTEPAFQNEYWDEKRPGIYVGYNTREPLFSSLDKYDSGTGWPSFTKPINDSLIKREKDESIGVERTEVKTDSSHLGHVFDDGLDGGERFCINSAALKFIPYEDLEKEGYKEYKKLFPYEEAVIAGGCFWGVEYLLEDKEGIVKVVSGYANSKIENPTYNQVSSGKTGSAEAVLVIFDPEKISYSEILDYFWRLHNPTEVNRQGPDIGTQYRSAIFYVNEEQKKIAKESKSVFDSKEIFEKPAATEITEFENFYKAEDYHQNYVENNPGSLCHALREE